MFEGFEVNNFPLENILRKKLWNLYKDRDIEELKKIIIEVEIKNVYLMKEIENLKNMNMRLEQKLIDEKNNKSYKNLFKERKIRQNKFMITDSDLGVSNLKIPNDTFIKKELDINNDEGNDLELYDMMLNAELNEKNFEELKNGISIFENKNQFEKKKLNNIQNIKLNNNDENLNNNINQINNEDYTEDNSNNSKNNNNNNNNKNKSININKDKKINQNSN